MTKGHRQVTIMKGKFKEEAASTKAQVGSELSKFKAEEDQEANVACRYSTRRKVA